MCVSDQASRRPAQGQDRQKGSGRRPVTAHPLFPALVALWFGALFGLGSLAIRTGLLEAMVLKLRIDLIVPFAAPPLGMKARILLALGMAIGGALAGLWIGRRLQGGPKAPKASGGLFAGLARVAGREGNPAPAARRRPLTTNVNYERDFSGDHAPLPGGQPQFLSSSDYDFITHVEERKGAAYGQPVPQDGALLDLDGFLAEPMPAPEHNEGRPAEAPALRPFDMRPAAVGPAPIAPPAAMPVSSERPFAAPPAFAKPAEPVQTDALITPVVEVPVAQASAPDAGSTPAPAVVHEGMTHLDLVNRLAGSMQARRERIALARAAAATVEAAPAPAPAEPATMQFEPVNFEPVRFEPVATFAAEATLPAATGLTPETAEPAGMRRFDAPSTADASTVIVPPPMGMPAALRPLSFDEHADDEPDISHVPPRSISFPQAAPAEHVAEALTEAGDEAEAEAENDLEGGYSSLLELSRPAQPRHAFIRIEDHEADAGEAEPVVVFPGQAPRPFDAPRPAAYETPSPALTPVLPAVAEAAAPVEPAAAPRPFDAPAQPAAPASIPAVRADREETERALRTALATLQRMSGAA